jgi:hypothetical protein
MGVWFIPQPIVILLLALIIMAHSPFLSAINVALDKTLSTNLELVKEVDYLVRCYYAQMFALMVKIMSEETFEQSTCLFCNQLHVHEKFMALSPDLCELIIVFWLSFLIC